MTNSAQPTVTLSPSVAMPQFGLGVYLTPPEETASVVARAVEAGYRAVDTASVYRNEEGVGEGLDGHPDVFVTTKLWNGDQGYDEALRAFDDSAGKLRREVIDLYLIHWPLPAIDRYVDSWKALIRLQQEGRVRAIGVSNFLPDHIERLEQETGVLPSINQVELHPRFQQKALRDYHAKKGIVTQSWSPLGQANILGDPILTDIAAKHGRTPAQVVIRWHLDNGLVVIPKTVKTERLKENIGVFDFALDAGDLDRIAALDAADGRIGPDPANFNVTSL